EQVVLEPAQRRKRLLVVEKTDFEPFTLVLGPLPKQVRSQLAVGHDGLRRRMRGAGGTFHSFFFRLRQTVTQRSTEARSRCMRRRSAVFEVPSSAAISRRTAAALPGA